MALVARLSHELTVLYTPRGSAIRRPLATDHSIWIGVCWSRCWISLSLGRVTLSAPMGSMRCRIARAAGGALGAVGGAFVRSGVDESVSSEPLWWGS